MPALVNTKIDLEQRNHATFVISLSESMVFSERLVNSFIAEFF